MYVHFYLLYLYAPVFHFYNRCECNPESALRVQYLRLVHNFYDRDFLYNQAKELMLCPQELSLVRAGLDPFNGELPYIQLSKRGLISRILAVFSMQPVDSIYRLVAWNSLPARCVAFRSVPLRPDPS